MATTRTPQHPAVWRPTTALIFAAGLVMAVSGATFAQEEMEEEAGLEGATLGVTNTIEMARSTDEGGTDGAELPIETLMSAPEGSLAAEAVVGEGVEFPAFIGLWEIDASGEAIGFANIVAKEPVAGFFRIIEPGTFDRYYFAADVDLDGLTPTVEVTGVSVELGEDGRLVVTIGEGYDTTSPGFTVDLAGGSEGEAARISANDASRDELVVALEAVGVPSASRWAREIMEYRPYPDDDPSLGKLQDNLAKYNPSPETLEAILRVLEP